MAYEINGLINMFDVSRVTTPKYAKKARLVGVSGIPARLGVSHDAIAREAKVHKNTVSSALNGDNKQFAKAHDIFTAINKIASNAFSREDYVYFIDDADEAVRDPSLEKCVVFQNFRSVLASNGIGVSEISGELGSGSILILQDMEKGYPVDKSFAEEVIRILQDRGVKLRNDTLIK